MQNDAHSIDSDIYNYSCAHCRSFAVHDCLPFSTHVNLRVSLLAQQKVHPLYVAMEPKNAWLEAYPLGQWRALLPETTLSVWLNHNLKIGIHQHLQTRKIQNLQKDL